MKSFLILLLAAFTVSAQTADPQARLMERDCLGECALRSDWRYAVPETAGPLTLTIETATYALCPSHLAGLEIEVNGKFLDHFVLDPASVHAYTVQPGDQIRVKGRLRLVNGAVRCIRFGQVTYTIRLTNPQQ